MEFLKILECFPGFIVFILQLQNESLWESAGWEGGPILVTDSEVVEKMEFLTLFLLHRTQSNDTYVEHVKVLNNRKSN